MTVAALLLLATLAHVPPALPLRSGRSCEGLRCYSVHLSPRPMTLREAQDHCRRTGHGRGHLAAIRSRAEALQLASLLDSVAPDFPAELWLGLRRDRRACRERPCAGPLRGFAWSAAGGGGGGDAGGDAGAGDESYVSWRRDEPATRRSLARCATLSHGARGGARAAVVELRARGCADATGVRGVACRRTREGHGGQPERLVRAEREGERREGREAAQRHKRDATGACEPGYEFSSAEGGCEDVDECDAEDRCDNGLCSNSVGSFVCDCFPGYSKLNATACADVDECLEDHLCGKLECINRSGYYECGCPVGYRQHANGFNCLDVDECSGGGRGGCEHDCVNAQGGYACACRAGYELAPDGKSCSEWPTVAPPGTPEPTTNEMALLANAQPSPGASSKGPATGLFLWALLGLVSVAAAAAGGVLLFRRYRGGARRRGEPADGSERGRDVRLDSQPLAPTEASL